MTIVQYLEVDILDAPKEMYGVKLKTALLVVKIRQNESDVFLDIVVKGESSDKTVFRDILNFVSGGEETDDEIEEYLEHGNRQPSYFNPTVSIIENSRRFMQMGFKSHLNVTGGLIFEEPD